MKFVIRASRYDTFCNWRGIVGSKDVTACYSDVDSLFAGLTKKLRADFEISNEKPRYHDYHTFEWLRSDARYATIEVTGDKTYLTSWVSQCIAKVFSKKKGEKHNRIYVTVY